MKERPILFSTPMVQAILDGRKTMTRRILKRQPDSHHWEIFNEYKLVSNLINTAVGLVASFMHTVLGKGYYDSDVSVKCPYGNVGDILWVRETWQKLLAEGGGFGYTYKANNHPFDRGTKWKPSIYMPREACRIMLEITNIRVERLQDISEQDAISEGITMNNLPWEGWYWMENVYAADCPLLAYEQLWEKINGPESWDKNPWVWVITFKRTQPYDNSTKQTGIHKAYLSEEGQGDYQGPGS